MQIKLEELRDLIKKTISESSVGYFGGTTMGGLASTALNKVGNVPGGSSVDMPPDPVELAKQIRALIGGDAGYPVGEWGDVALNAAAEVAADALIDTEHRDKTRRSPSGLGEQKKYLKEVREIIEDIETQKTIDPDKLTLAMERIIKILDSMDMSLNLVYSALTGYEGPVSGIAARQRAFGRAMGVQRTGGAPAPTAGGE